MFAVVQTGGKQYRVAVGQSIQVEKLPNDKGDSIEFERVLMVGEGDQVTAGTPLVAGARVLATVSRQERGPKILVFRYKSKKRVRVLRGHRQSLTQLFIRDIIVNGESTATSDSPVATAVPAAAPAATAVVPQPAAKPTRVATKVAKSPAPAKPAARAGSAAQAKSKVEATPAVAQQVATTTTAEASPPQAEPATTEGTGA